MDLSKSLEFFNPMKDTSTVHIIGCGSVGSTVAENLARCGVAKFALWDFDNVEPHNIANQMFTQKQIGMRKVDALKDIILDINPDAEIRLEPNGWNGQILSGYLFLAVDSIDIRREIVQKHIGSQYVKAFFDVRTMLTGAQHYAAAGNDFNGKQNLLKTMNFTHEEAAEDTPVSACGVTLGVATTVRLISALCVNNYIRFVKGEGLWKFVQIDGFSGILDCF